jgi:hypothetical protein
MNTPRSVPGTVRLGALAALATGAIGFTGANYAASSTSSANQVGAAPDWVAPLPTLTVPSAGTRINDATPTFAGVAGDVPGDGDAVNVELYAGATASGAPLHTYTASRAGTNAWSVDGSDVLPEGTYTARATQSDSGNNTGNSAAHTFTVDTTAPAVTLDAPVANLRTTDDTPTISGTASAAGGDGTTVQVKLYGGSSASGSPLQSQDVTVGGGVWTVDATTLADGTYTAQATHADSAGNTAASNPRTFTIDRTGPAPTISSPAAASRTVDTTPSLAGAAGTATGDQPGMTVRVYAGSGTGGTLVQTLSTTAVAGLWNVDAGTLVDGTYTAQAAQSDDLANSGTSAGRTFTVDTAPPALTFASPADGASVNDATPTLDGAAGNATGDDTTVTLTFFDGPAASGSPLRTVPVTRAGADWTHDAATLADGEYTVVATQADDLGHSVSHTHSFTIDTVAPTVSLEAPFDGQVTNDDTPTLWGFAGLTPGDNASVDIRIYAGTGTSGTLVQTAPAVRDPGTGEYTVDAAHLADGTYTALAAQDDAAGNTATSLTATFKVDTVAPAPTLVKPNSNSRGSDSTPRFSGVAGNAPGDDTVVIVDVWSGATAGGPPLRSYFASRGSGTTWQVDASPALPDGTYTARVTQSDAASNAGLSNTRTFTIDTVQPVVTLATPANGSTTAINTPTLSGAAGTATGDDPVVHVSIWAGAGTGGTPVQDLNAPVSGTTWSIDAALLPDGVYTVLAFQDDSAGNGGFSSSNTFTVATS